jgi:DNA-binding response OmpR family regulator
MYVLLVEDDLNLGKTLSGLLSEHYRVQWVRTVEAASNHFAAADYDVVLLDLGLPDGDGVDWLRALRAAGRNTPVLIMSARDAIDDRVLGLDSGADDYLVKPFEAEELLARIRVLLRGRSGSARPHLTAGDLSFDPVHHEFYMKGAPLKMTPTEHRLLAVLIHAGTRAVTRERLARQIYGSENHKDSNTVEVHIHGLRKLLGKERIETIRGVGYRLVAR